MITDDQLDELYRDYLIFTDKMAEKYGAMSVAAIMVAQALTIYKSAMSEEDFNNMVDGISASRGQVKTFEKVVLQ